MPAGTAVAKAANIRAKALKKGLKGRRADRFVKGAMDSASMTKAQQTLAKRPRVAADY